jgi:hypothetical protein
MKRIFSVLTVVAAFTIIAFPQSKSAGAIRQQIKSAHADKALTLSFDPATTSKLMGVSENFSDGEAGSAGVRAMNFAVGFFFAGQELTKSPDQIMLTFWVLTKKPRFAENHHLTVFLPAEILDLGDARYAAKARTGMEYLNFDISRENLAKIARESSARIHLGDHDFTFSRAQLKLLADLLLVSDISAAK